MTPEEILAQYGPREAMEYDVAIVGAGPAGLATAIRLKQLAAEHSQGGLGRRAREGLGARRAHPLGRDHGSARDHRAAAELEGKRRAAEPAGHRRPASCSSPRPARTATPHVLLPDCFHNHGNYVISLGNVVQAGWRRRPRRSASRSSRAFRPPRCSTTTTARCKRRGHRQPRRRQGRRAAPTSFQLGMELHAQVHDLRRRLARQPRPPADRALQARRRRATRRATAIGLKELWEVAPDKAQARPRRAHRRLAARHRRPTAARSSITSTTTRSSSASSSASTTRIRT